MFEEIFENVRRNAPLIHNITNYVTVNDCANMLLACGASPIMADDPEDALEITAICALTKSIAPPRFSSVTLSATSASTPLVFPLPRARVLISETLPRITVNLTSLSRPRMYRLTPAELERRANYEVR